MSATYRDCLQPKDNKEDYGHRRNQRGIILNGAEALLRDSSVIDPSIFAAKIQEIGFETDDGFRNKTLEEMKEQLRKVVDQMRGMFSGAIQVTSLPDGDKISPVVEAAEAQPSRLLSFAELKSFLKEHRIDLGKELEDDVRSMIRWGALTIKDSDKYGRAFEENFEPVSEADLQELVRQLKAEPNLKQRVILGVDSLTFDQEFQRFIVEAGIRHICRRLFPEYQRVDPRTRQPLQNQMPTGKAGILFTPNHLNLPDNLRGILANDQLSRMVNGQKYVGPVGWMKLFRQSVDRALPILYPKKAGNLDSLKPERYKELVKKALLDTRIDEYLIDVRTATQFPDLRHKDDGAVLSLGFDPCPVHRRVELDGDCPEYPQDSLGGRDALGTLLS